MDELLKLHVCDDRVNSLRLFYDKVSVHVRGLQSLGVSSTELYYISGDRALDFKVSPKTWRI